MKVGILGTGDVARSLANGFGALGYTVMLGARDAANEKAAAWAAQAGDWASAGTFADAATFGKTIVVATLGVATENAVRMAGPASFDGKIVLDTTNPLDFSGGFPPKLAPMNGGSAGAALQALLPNAKVVKVFNTVGHLHMFKPDFPGGPPDMFIAGNDAQAKAAVTSLLKQFGWDTVDSGGIEASAYLEGMCLVWVYHGVTTDSWNHAFKLLRK